MLSLSQTVDVYVEKSTCYSQTSKKNLVRTVQAFSLHLGPRFYFSLNQIFIYLVNKSIVIIKRGGLISLQTLHVIISVYFNQYRYLVK